MIAIRVIVIERIQVVDAEFWESTGRHFCDIEVVGVKVGGDVDCGGAKVDERAVVLGQSSSGVLYLGGRPSIGLWVATRWATGACISGLHFLGA